MGSTTGKRERSELERRPVPIDYERPLAAFQREVNRLFGDFWEGVDIELWHPGVDVSETADTVIVTAELPGVEERDLDVTLSGGVLTIKGEKRRQHEEPRRNYYMQERSYGRIDRAIRLPARVDEDQVTARFRAGVLTVEAPKCEETKPKHIALTPDEPNAD